MKNPFPLAANRSLSFAQLFCFSFLSPAPRSPQACFWRAPAWTAKPGSWSSPAPKFCTSRCPSSTSTRSTPRPGRTPSSTSAPFTGSRQGQFAFSYRPNRGDEIEVRFQDGLELHRIHRFRKRHRSKTLDHERRRIALRHKVTAPSTNQEVFSYSHTKKAPGKCPVHEISQIFIQLKIKCNSSEGNRFKHNLFLFLLGPFFIVLNVKVHQQP